MDRRAFLTQATASLASAVFASRLPRQSAQRDLLTSLTSDLDRRIPVWLKEARVPGLSIAVIQDARVAWRRAFGVKDASSGAAIGLDTMFEAASMSKPVFAYVVMKLVEQGKLGLDVPLTRYAVEPFLKGDDRLELITARQVLSHTSGFQNWRSEKTPLAIQFTPGAQYMYSGEGYNYLQTVVTRLVGQPFEIYMAERLFAPTGMSSSCYLWTDMAAQRMARAHDREGKPADNPRPTTDSVARFGSAGALLSTPGDYASFVCAVIRPPAADGFKLGPDRVKEMLRPHIKLEGQPFPSSWALGWQIFHTEKRDFIFHGGSNAGFKCAAIASVAGQSGYVAMTNGENGNEVLTKILTSDAMQTFLTA